MRRLVSRCQFRISHSKFSTKELNILSSFHKRPLPKSLVALSSIEGKKLFREALAEGGMESFFGLSEQFITQSEPSYCALSSLAMVLNALNYDPKKVWKGAWRWVSEEMLQCESSDLCRHSVEDVMSNGMDFNDFEMLGKCHGVSIQSFRACSDSTGGASGGIQQFRDSVKRISTSAQAESFIITNFSRKYLDQTGIGHFSPIGGYHPSKDLVLIMDVARFKYPPFWVSVDRLWGAMQISDAETNMSRGYFIVSTLDIESKAKLHDHSNCRHRDGPTERAFSNYHDDTRIAHPRHDEQNLPQETSSGLCSSYQISLPTQQISRDSLNQEILDSKSFDIKHCPVSKKETCQPGCGHMPKSSQKLKA